MLAEKFFLVLETLRSHASDGSVKVISTAPHVPAKCAAVLEVEDSDEWRERRTVWLTHVWRAVRGVPADDRPQSKVARHDDGGR